VACATRTPILSAPPWIAKEFLTDTKEYLMSFTQKSNDLFLMIHFVCAVLLAMFALVAFATTVVAMWKDSGLLSFLISGSASGLAHS
jgi:hypothetical protein